MTRHSARRAFAQRAAQGCARVVGLHRLDLPVFLGSVGLSNTRTSLMEHICGSCRRELHPLAIPSNRAVTGLARRLRARAKHSSSAVVMSRDLRQGDELDFIARHERELARFPCTLGRFDLFGAGGHEVPFDVAVPNGISAEQHHS